jgi:hypothetical protein
MAIPADTVWEVETTGDDTNGGGFSIVNKGATGVDMTYGGSTAIVTFTSTLSAVGTTTLTDSAAGFLNTMLGNVINIVGQGFYCIVGFTTTSVVTVDRNLGTFSTTSGKVGGATATFGVVGGVVVAANTIFIKSGTYTITTASTNVSNGCVSMASGCIWVGFSTTRTVSNNDTMPSLVIGAGVSAATIFTGSGYIINLSLDGTLQTTSRGCNTTASYKCKFSNFTNTGANATSVLSEFTGCTTQPACNGNTLSCVAHGNTAASFGGAVVINCIAYANTATPFSTNICVSSVAYGNTGASTDGFTQNTTGSTVCVNCIAESNGRYGFLASASSANHLLINCSTYNNGTAATSGVFQSIGVLTTPSSAFVTPASQDFRLNNTAGAGALLRAAGFPSTWPSVSTSMLNYLDIGSAQHQDSPSLTVFNVLD